MATAVALLRPNGVHSIYGAWTPINAGSHDAAQADASDVSSSRYDSSGGSGGGNLNLRFEDLIAPGGGVVQSVQNFKVRCRFRAITISGSADDMLSVRALYGDGAGGYAAPNVYEMQVIVFGTNTHEVTGVTRTAKHDGTPLDKAYIDGIVTSIGVSDVSNPNWDVFAQWLEVSYTYNSPPPVASSTTRTGALSDNTPNFAAVITNPEGDQVKARFEIYQSDGVTLIGTVDSAYITGSGTATAEWASPLALGSYKVRSKMIDSGGLESAWGSMTSFDVAQLATKDLTALWDVNEQAVKNLAALWNVELNNVKQLVALWNVMENTYKDISLIWNVKTAWTKQIESDSIWTKVGEL